MTVQRTWRNKKIIAELTFLDSGVHVLLSGGDSSHIGAVSLRSDGTELSTMAFPGHREDVLSEKWANTLFEHLHCPVSVAAGIHYDGVSRDEIRDIVALTDEMLAEVISYAYTER